MDSLILQARLPPRAISVYSCPCSILHRIQPTLKVSFRTLFSRLTGRVPRGGSKLAPTQGVDTTVPQHCSHGEAKYASVSPLSFLLADACDSVPITTCDGISGQALDPSAMERQSHEAYKADTDGRVWPH